MSQARDILTTIALPYANGQIHLGHLVEGIQADIWVRFQRLVGHRCWFVCGNDAHGTAVMLSAEKKGVCQLLVTVGRTVTLHYGDDTVVSAKDGKCIGVHKLICV